MTVPAGALEVRGALSAKSGVASGARRPLRLSTRRGASDLAGEIGPASDPLPGTQLSNIRVDRRTGRTDPRADARSQPQLPAAHARLSASPMSRDICLGCPDTQHNADERTRTSTWLPRHGPEPCASTNSATSARRWPAKIAHGTTDEPWVGPVSSGQRPGAAWADTCSGRFASLDPADCAPLSSRGLGRRPLMAETRVRIPVAVLTKAL